MTDVRSPLPIAMCLVCREWLFLGIHQGDPLQPTHRHEGHPASAWAADGTLRPDLEAVAQRLAVERASSIWGTALRPVEVGPS